ncbi:MAG: TIGR04219 family outer membrane beta-barrel protein [Nitrospirae bacterium]|nr:TIGR04219 family outer membrane beta-barrel protein [Nitrospirota bacterium]
MLVPAFICMAPYAASAIGFEAAVGGWKQDPSGDISYKGQALDIDNELKYNSKTKVFGRVKIDMPLILPNIYLMATPMKFEADGSKTSNFTFGDKTFNYTAPFSSKINLDHYDVALYYGLPFIKTATAKKLNIDIGLNARIIDFKAEISGQDAATGLQIKESKSLTLPVPMLYVGVQIKPVSLLSVEAEARGIAYGSNHYYDLIGRLKVKPFGPVFLAGGYRLEDIKIDESNVKANIKFKGPFVEAGFEF